MNTEEFKKNYLKHYLLLEKDFRETFDYLSVEQDNYAAYSSIFLKILLSVGSEIDIMKKFLAHILDPNFDEQKDNANNTIINNAKDFKELEVKIFTNESIIKPWDYPKEPEWWTAYNEIKHNRLESAIKFNPNRKYYQYANQKNVLYALCALYSLEMYAYRMISLSCNEKMIVPNVKTLFCINNSYWTGIIYGNGMIYFDGTLYVEN